MRPITPFRVQRLPWTQGRPVHARLFLWRKGQQRMRHFSSPPPHRPPSQGWARKGSPPGGWEMSHATFTQFLAFCSPVSVIQSLCSKTGLLFRGSSASHFLLLRESKAEKTAKCKRSGTNSCAVSHTSLTAGSKNPFSVSFSSILF